MIQNRRQRLDALKMKASTVKCLGDSSDHYCLKCSQSIWQYVTPQSYYYCTVSINYGVVERDCRGCRLFCVIAISHLVMPGWGLAWTVSWGKPLRNSYTTVLGNKLDCLCSVQQENSLLGWSWSPSVFVQCCCWGCRSAVCFCQVVGVKCHSVIVIATFFCIDLQNQHVHNVTIISIAVYKLLVLLLLLLLLLKIVSCGCTCHTVKCHSTKSYC